MKPEEKTQEVLDKAIEVVTTTDENEVEQPESDKQKMPTADEAELSDNKDESSNSSSDDTVEPKEDSENNTADKPTDSIPDNTATVTANKNDSNLPETKQDFKIHTDKPASKKISKKVFIIVLVMILAFSAVAAYIYTKNEDPQPAVMGIIEENKMSAVSSIVDGEVSYSNNGETWQELKVDQALTQGDWVETAVASRAVLVLDDGSAIRLNENTKIVLTSTNPDAIVITNKNGEVYTRVVTNTERTFTVVVGDNDYQALGTAYKTVNTEKVKGVQVYHSSVKSGDITIEEGKQWLFVDGTDNKVQDISIDTLKSDEFVKWNAEQDKASNEFKEKLGFLGNLDKPVVEPQPAPAPAPGASIKLSGSAVSEKGIQLSWSVANLGAVDGYKIVKSTTNSSPVFGKDGSMYIKGSATKSYLWDVKDGNKYYIRVCGYVASNSSCNVYSNAITVTAPKVEKTSSGEPSGTLALFSKGGTKVGWTLNGNAPYGYKLVWNTTGSPVYPGSDYQYYSDPATSYGFITEIPGTYKVRVCIYNNGSCFAYSNEIEVIIPAPATPLSR